MDVICQCGKIRFKTPLPKPLAVYICHCDECRRQSSSAFGCSAIFPHFPLPSPELMSVYTRPTASGHLLNCYFCRCCGTRLIHSTPGKNVVSVKGGAIEGLDWSAAKHIWCKRAMVPIPEGVEQSPEEPKEDLQQDPEGWGQDEGMYGCGYNNRDSGGCGERSIKVPSEGNKEKGWDVNLNLVG